MRLLVAWVSGVFLFKAFQMYNLNPRLFHDISVVNGFNGSGYQRMAHIHAVSRLAVADP